MNRWCKSTLFLGGLALSLGAGQLVPAACAAPKKPAAKKTAAKKPPVKKAPLPSQGGATQISAVEGEVGKAYVNNDFRVLLQMPRAALAHLDSGAGEGNYWLIFPFEASNATKGQLDFTFHEADLADDQAHTIKVEHQPEIATLLPAAHTKGEIAFIVPYTVKPMKVVLQPNSGVPLRLMLPKGYTVSAPKAEGKMPDAVSNGLVRVSITAPTTAAKYKGEDAQEDHTWLLVAMEMVSEFAERTEIDVPEVVLQNADGQQFTASENPAITQLAPVAN